MAARWTTQSPRPGCTQKPSPTPSVSASFASFPLASGADSASRRSRVAAWSGDGWLVSNSVERSVNAATEACKCTSPLDLTSRSPSLHMIAHLYAIIVVKM